MLNKIALLPLTRTNKDSSGESHDGTEFVSIVRRTK